MKKIAQAIAAFILLIVFAAGCTNPKVPKNNGIGSNGSESNDEVKNVVEVKVITSFPEEITLTSAVGGAKAVVKGTSLSELGVCWSTQEKPTASDAHLSTTAWEEPFSCTLADLEPNTEYHVRAYALCGEEYYYGTDRVFATHLPYEYVDLGLPSGTLWATRNVGASTPEKFGYDYAWGETTPVNYGNYKYGKGGYPLKPTKYCSKSENGYQGFTDTLTVLKRSDDVATVNCGGEWCMPTVDQWKELINNTTSKWITRKGVSGRLFKASNGNSIFLPGIGGYWANDIYVAESSIITYWSSSLYADRPTDAWCFNFDSDYIKVYHYTRDHGYSVRPVRVKR